MGANTYNLDTYDDELAADLAAAGLAAPVTVGSDEPTERTHTSDDRVDSSDGSLRALAAGGLPDSRGVESVAGLTPPPGPLPPPGGAKRPGDWYADERGNPVQWVPDFDWKGLPPRPYGAWPRDYSPDQRGYISLAKSNEPWPTQRLSTDVPTTPDDRPAPTAQPQSQTAAPKRPAPQAPLAPTEQPAQQSPLAALAGVPSDVDPHGYQGQGAITQASGQEPRKRYINAPPPVREDNNQGDAILATFLDLLLNKGRNLGLMTGAMLAPGRDTAYENWKRNAQAEQLNAQVADKYEQRGPSAMELELRKQALQNSTERTQAMLESSRAHAQSEQEKAAREKAQDDAAGPQAGALRKALVSLGADEDAVSDLTPRQMEKLAPSLVAPGTDARAVAKAIAIARGTSAAKQPYELEQIKARGDQADENAKAKEARKAAAVGGGDEALDDFEETHPNLQIVSRGTYTRGNASPRLLSRRLVDVQTADRALAASHRLGELAKEWSLAKAARNPAAARAAEQEYQLYKDEHQGIILKIAGMSGGGTSGERTDIKDLIPERLNPAAVARLEGTERFIVAQAHEMLRVHGIGVRGFEGHGTKPATGSGKPKAKPAPAPAAAADDLPVVTDDELQDEDF